MPKPTPRSAHAPLRPRPLRAPASDTAPHVSGSHWTLTAESPPPHSAPRRGARRRALRTYSTRLARDAGVAGHTPATAVGARRPAATLTQDPPFATARSSGRPMAPRRACRTERLSRGCGPTAPLPRGAPSAADSALRRPPARSAAGLGRQAARCALSLPLPPPSLTLPSRPPHQFGWGGVPVRSGHPARFGCAAHDPRIEPPCHPSAGRWGQQRWTRGAPPRPDSCPAFPHPCSSRVHTAPPSEAAAIHDATHRGRAAVATDARRHPVHASLADRPVLPRNARTGGPRFLPPPPRTRAGLGPVAMAKRARGATGRCAGALRQRIQNEKKKWRSQCAPCRGGVATRQPPRWWDVRSRRNRCAPVPRPAPGEPAGRCAAASGRGRVSNSRAP